MTTMTSNKMKTYDMVCIAIFAVLMAVCSWIAIPTACLLYTSLLSLYNETRFANGLITHMAVDALRCV